jgi:AraC family transcriptional regulator of adaptative response/methylated-DNA-[protein]-cysteine methyltransferase
MTPAAYRAGGKGMQISYTIVSCPLGRMLVAATERGVCAVSFGEKDAELEKALHAEYPKADIRRDEERLGEWVQALLRHLAGGTPQMDLPLDVQATAFQLRVWEELRRIPYGERRSYAQIARSLGQPKAARAVARACAANPAAVIIPCHRVLRNDGSLGGYRWGLERKKALLERESSSRIAD